MKESKRVIYALRANQLVTQALADVEGPLNWRPCCILAERENLKFAREQYPEALILDNRTAHVDVNEKFYTLGIFYDNEIRSQYGKYETEVCKNLERVLPSMYHSAQERLFFYHVWLSYWLEQFERMRPEVVFFINSPMLPSHFILYLVCLEEKVEMLIGNNISHPRRLINFKPWIESLPIGFEDSFAEKMQRFAEEGEAVVSAWTQEYFKTNQVYKVPDYLAEKQQKESCRTLELIRSKLTRRLVTSIMFKPMYIMAYGYYLVTGKHRMELLLRERKKGQLVHYYHSISAPRVSLDEKFLYLPLHYQPERSTSPDAGIFADQHLIVKTLDRALPKGWKIYVKEHPSQFASYNEGEKGRELDDYKEMERIQSIRFVREDFPTEKLIQHAQAVVTCTGTAGWEAVLRQVPVLIFGIIWYDLCPGVFRVRSVKEVRDALQRICNGEKPDETQAKLLIDSIIEKSCPLWVPGTDEFNRKGFTACLTQAYSEKG